jgi:hypothetical protein
VTTRAGVYGAHHAFVGAEGDGESFWIWHRSAALVGVYALVAVRDVTAEVLPVLAGTNVHAWSVSANSHSFGGDWRGAGEDGESAYESEETADLHLDVVAVSDRQEN